MENQSSSKPKTVASPRGTQDFLGTEAERKNLIIERARKVGRLYGYQAVETPIFEFSEVFHRSMGETSDAVSKETYTFLDRGGDSITLRPEGTAGVVRALISNGWAQHLPMKLFYSGPMFRYERPQKGRYRQFDQLGVESLGTQDPLADVECMALAWQIIEDLGLQNQAKLEINSLGDRTSRDAHREALVKYFLPLQSQLSPDSQARLTRNPLRILDSKDINDRKLLENCPRLEDHLTETSRTFFAQVQAGLAALNIPFTLNSRLVRGLDYYTHTVFEITTEALGAQGTLLAGGRYDGLVSQLGGPEVAGVGFAAGVERLSLLATQVAAPTLSLLAVMPADPASQIPALALTQELRNASFACELLLSGNMGKRFAKAAKLNAKAALILGESEIANTTVAVKWLATGEQAAVPRAELQAWLKNKLNA